jgi:hypothetical protein
MGSFGVTSFMNGMTGTDAVSAWSNRVGRPVGARKWYNYNLSDGNGSEASFPAPATYADADDVIKSCIDDHLVCYLCYRPFFNNKFGGTSADKAALLKSLKAFQRLGVKNARVILFQEVEMQYAQEQGPDAIHYFKALSYYGSTIQSVYPGGLMHDASSSYSTQWKTFMPAEGLVDGAGIDFYGSTFTGSTGNNGINIDAYIALVKSTMPHTSFPFKGVFEMGLSLPSEHTPNFTQAHSYMSYLLGLAEAHPAATFMWYQNDSRNCKNLIPGYSSGQGKPACGTGFNLVPDLQALHDAVCHGTGKC